MNPLRTPSIVIMSLWLSVFLVTSAHGQSLDDLDKEVNESVKKIKYKDQLLKYLDNHNVKLPLNDTAYPTSELENLVKAFKIYCKTGNVTEFYNTTLQVNNKENCNGEELDERLNSHTDWMRLIAEYNLSNEQFYRLSLAHSDIMLYESK